MRAEGAASPSQLLHIVICVLRVPFSVPPTGRLGRCIHVKQSTARSYLLKSEPFLRMVSVSGSFVVGYMPSPQNVCSPEQAVTGVGVSGAQVRCLALDWREWPIGTPRTGRQRTVCGWPARHSASVLVLLQPLTLVGLHSGHLSPDIRTLVPLRVTK